MSVRGRDFPAGVARPEPAPVEAPAPATADPQWLYGFWYPALRSPAVRGTRMASAMLLGIPLVLGRTARGEAFALRDSCPHRGIPLSYGRFDGGEVGWGLGKVVH